MAPISNLSTTPVKCAECGHYFPENECEPERDGWVCPPCFEVRTERLLSAADHSARAA